MTKAEWIDQAVMELGRRMPGLSPDEVARIVTEHLWQEASDWDPREAAEVYALEAPPTDPGAPGD